MPFLLSLYLLHDVFYFVLFTVQDHPPLFLVLQILEQRAVSLILPLVFQVPHVYGCHLPLPLRRCVQDNLQRRQAWEWKQSGIKTFIILSVCLIYPWCSLVLKTFWELFTWHILLINGIKTCYDLWKKVIKNISFSECPHNICAALLLISLEVAL